MTNEYLNQQPEFSSYFASLPITVQETIKQSAVCIDSVDDLKKIAENLMRTN